MGALTPPSQQDTRPRVIDERPRSYRLTTPRQTRVGVELAGADDQVTIKLSRPIDVSLGMNTSPQVDLSREEAWAVWAVLCDGLGAAGEPPDWTAGPLPAYGPDGNELPPLPGAPPAEPF